MPLNSVPGHEACSTEVCFLFIGIFSGWPWYLDVHPQMLGLQSAPFFAKSSLAPCHAAEHFAKRHRTECLPVFFINAALVITTVAVT